MRGVFVAICAVAVLGGCSGNADTPSAVPPSGTAEPVPQVTDSQLPLVSRPPSPLSAEPDRLDRFAAAVREQLPEVAMDRRDEEVEAFGEQACRALAAGEKAPAVAGEISSQGVTSADARKLVALAGSTACPDRPKV